MEAELVEAGSGPGRVWGYRGLRPVIAVRQVTSTIGGQAGRLMRRWYRAKRLTKQITVERVDRATGRVHTRRTRVRKRLFAHNRGFATDDGPAFASQLARYLATLGRPACGCHPVDSEMDDRAAARGQPSTAPAPDVDQLCSRVAVW